MLSKDVKLAASTLAVFLSVGVLPKSYAQNDDTLVSASKSLDNPEIIPNIILPNGFVVPQGSKYVSYKFDKLHRIINAKYPSGFEISNVAYLGDTNTVISLVISNKNDIKHYKRNNDGKGRYYSTWQVKYLNNTGKQEVTFYGDICFTPFGEYSFVQDIPGKPRKFWLTYLADETLVQTLPTWDGSQSYYDQKGTLLRLIRANLTQVCFENKANQLIAFSDGELTWKINNSGVWICNHSNVTPSRECPIQPNGILKYTLYDGSKVTVSTCGSALRCLPSRLALNFDGKGILFKLSWGIRSRILNYDQYDQVVSYTDKKGNYFRNITLEIPINLELNLNSEITNLDPKFRHILTASFLPSWQNQYQSFVDKNKIPKPPKFPKHVHYITAKIENSPCQTNVCPNESIGPNNTFQLLQENYQPPVMITKNSRPIILSWNKLDDLANKNNGELRNLIKILRIWAKNLTDQDIEIYTSPEYLAQFKGDSGATWFSEEMIMYPHSEFLYWLRETINSGNVPFHLEVKSLPSWSPASLPPGGTTEIVNKINGGIVINLNLQSLYFSNEKLREDIKRMQIQGGAGILYREQPTLAALFHELRHVYDHAHGIYSTQFGESIAYVNELICLMTITPEKAKNYD